MPEQWIIQVQGKEYGPADLATLREWKTDGRVLPTNPARRVDVEPAAGAGFAKEPHWKTAADIPGRFQVEPPPVQTSVPVRVSRPGTAGSIVADTAATKTKSKPPTRNILIETFRIYFRG